MLTSLIGRHFLDRSEFINLKNLVILYHKGPCLSGIVERGLVCNWGGGQGWVGTVCVKNCGGKRPDKFEVL